MASRRKPRETRTETEQAEEIPRGAALFSDKEFAEDWDHLAIIRTEPAEDEGFLGRVTIDTTEEQLRARFGGGTFKVQARDQGGNYKGQRTIKISGEPIFSSPAAEAKYRRANLLPAKPIDGPPPPAPAAAPAFGAAEIVTLMATMQAAADKSLQAFMQMQQEQQRQADERRRADDRERDERRRADDERRAREDANNRERDQMLFKSLLETARGGGSSGDQLSAFTQGMTVVTKMTEQIRANMPAAAAGGKDDDDDEKPDDPTATAVQAGARGLVDAIIGRMTGQGAAAAAPAVPALPPVAAPGSITLTGEQAAAAAELVRVARENGVDPDAIFSDAMKKTVTAVRRVAQRRAAPAAPTTTTPPAAAVELEPAPNAPVFSNGESVADMATRLARGQAAAQSEGGGSSSPAS